MFSFSFTCRNSVKLKVLPMLTGQVKGTVCPSSQTGAQGVLTLNYAVLNDIMQIDTPVSLLLFCLFNIFH